MCPSLMLVLSVNAQVAIQPLAPLDKIRYIESKSLANRQQVRSLAVTLRIKQREMTPTETTVNISKSVWSDGVRSRIDTVSDNPGLGRSAGRRRVECLGCERPGHFLTYTDLSDHVVAIDSRRPSQHMLNKGVGVDYRILGYSPSGIGTLHAERLDRYVGGSDRDNLTLTTDICDGSSCDVVRFTRNNGTVRVSIWYDVERGMHPLRITSEEGPVEKPTYQRELRCGVQAVSKDVWFPSSVMFTIRINQQVASIEQVDVLHVSINKPMPDSVFQLKGLDLPEDKMVTFEGPGASDYVWRKGKLVPIAEARKEWEKSMPAPEPVSLAPAKSPQYWLYALAAVLAMIATVFARRAFRKTT